MTEIQITLQTEDAIQLRSQMSVPGQIELSAIVSARIVAAITAGLDATKSTKLAAPN